MKEGRKLISLGLTMMEYILNEFIVFCNKEGINKEMIMPYNLKQNGVTETKNKPIVEAIRSMFHGKNLLKFLWG